MALGRFVNVSSTRRSGRPAWPPTEQINEPNVPDSVSLTVEVDGQQPLRLVRHPPALDPDTASTPERRAGVE